MPKEQKTVAEIADILREQIEAGEFTQGSRLPPSDDIAAKHDTSRDTVNRAIRQLQAEGFLESRGPKTRGVLVGHARMRLPGLTARFDLELEKLGLVPYEKNIDEPAIIPAPADIAKALGVQEGTPVVHRFRVQGETKPGRKEEERNIPYRLAENFYPTSLVDESILEQMQKNERLDVIVAIREKTGKAPVRVHEDLTVRLPRLRERNSLQITPQTSVLEIKRISYAEADTVVMVNKIILVASVFTLSYDYPVDHWKK